MWDWAFTLEILPILAKAAIIIDRGHAIWASCSPLVLGLVLAVLRIAVALDRLADLGCSSN